MDASNTFDPANTVPYPARGDWQPSVLPGPCDGSLLALSFGFGVSGIHDGSPGWHSQVLAPSPSRPVLTSPWRQTRYDHPSSSSGHRRSWTPSVDCRISARARSSCALCVSGWGCLGHRSKRKSHRSLDQCRPDDAQQTCMREGGTRRGCRFCGGILPSQP